MTQEQQKELMELITPVQQWLADNMHPHSKIILDCKYIEVVEGVFCEPDNKNVNLND